MLSVLRHLLTLTLISSLLTGGYFWLHQHLTTGIYRSKLQTMAADYGALIERYNDAVRRSAITELEVTENSLTVVIRTHDGQIRRIPTPFSPDSEIFVDYLVSDGRLWIRRVFDQATPPEQAVVIDPVWETVNWRDATLRYGKIVYRELQTGTWSIQVSGNGALSLEPTTRAQPDLLNAVPVTFRGFNEVEVELDAALEEIQLTDVWRYGVDLIVD